MVWDIIRIRVGPQMAIQDSFSYMDRIKRIWYLSPMRAAKVQASLRIRAVSPEPLLLAHTSSESRGTFRQKAKSLAPLNGWACPVKICRDGMLEDTNSLEGAHIIYAFYSHFNMVWIANTEIVCLFVLRFYGPVNSYGHVEPVSYPLTLFLGRLRPTKHATSSNWQLPLGYNGRDHNISVCPAVSKEMRH